MKRKLLSSKQCYLFLIVLLTTLVGNVNGATYYSRVTTGNFATLATWSTSPTGTPTNTTALANTDVFIIQNGHTITVAATQTVAGITVNIGGQLTIGGITFTVTGITAISGSVLINSNTNAKTFSGLVTINSGGTWTSTLATTAARVVFQGGIINNSTNIFSAGGATFNTSAQNLSGTGSFSFQSPTITGVNVTNNSTLSVTTALTGTGTLTNSSTGTLNLSGSCAITTLVNTGIINRTATGTTTTALANFTNTGTINISGSGTIAGITNNTGGIVNHSGSSTITSFNNATSTSTLNISALPVPTFTTLTVSAAGNTVNYNGAGNQTVKDVAYSNLTISGTGSKTWTLGAARTIGGILTVSSGTLTTTGNQTFGVTGTTSINGTINLGGTSAKTFTGAVTINSNGNWNNTGNSATSFTGGITHNGTTFNNGTGAAAFSANQSLAGTGNMTFDGSVTPASGTTLSNSNSGTVTINNIVLTGNFTQGFNTPTLALTNAAPFSGTGTFDASTNTNAVNYSGAAQTVKATTYVNLIFSGTGAKTIATGTSVASNLTISVTAAKATIGAGLNINVGNLTFGSTNQICGTWGYGPATPPTNKDQNYFSASTGYLSVGIPQAAGSITGASSVIMGQTGVVYTVPAISGATSYNWAYSGTGATINGTGNSVTIDFSSNATSGNLTVAGSNGSCSGTTSAAFPITVYPSFPFWYKADAGVTGSSMVTAWADQSGNTNNATNSGTVSLTLNSINYNPSLQFTSVDRQFSVSTSSTVQSFIVVNKSPSTGNDLSGLIGADGDKGIRLTSSTIPLGPVVTPYESWRGDNNADDWVNTTNGGIGRINGSVDANMLHSSKWHIANLSRYQSFVGSFYIGGYVAGRGYTGDIAEVMAFAGNIPNQDYVESYLAIKYGITLPGNFYASDGTATWTLVSGYQNDVHGIGKDDTYGLNQLSSKSENPGTDILIIQGGATFSTPSNAQTGTALTNRQFFITGHNNGTTTAFSTLSTGINILGRKWNSQVTNSLPTESFQFNLTGATIPTPYCKIGLLITDDAAFTTNPRFEEGTYSSPNLTVNNVALTNGKYFTVATLLSPSTGAISGTQTICYGTSPTILTSSTDGTGFGTISYLWESSTDGSTWNTVNGATSSTYPPGALTQTIQYRRTTFATLGTVSCNSTSSTSVIVTVRPVFTAGTISNTGQIICSGTVPTTQIGSTTAASGGDNTITYQWQYSTDNTFATGVTTVASNTATYTPTQSLAQTTYYRRQAHDGTCNTSFTSSTNTWTVTVRPVFTAGTISNTGQTICSGTIPTTQIGSTTTASGGDNTITYQWQYSTDNTFATGVTTVASNTATYTPTQSLAQTTYYRRQAHDGTCNTSFTSSTNTWTITVRPVFTAGTISNTGQTICSGTIPTTQIGSTTAASGGDNTITYQWQYSTDNTFATGVTTVASNTATYTPTQSLTQTTYYRRQAHDVTCNTSFTSSTNTWIVTVRPVFTAGTISNTGQTICSGTIPTTQIGSTTAASGGDNTITYQWQYSTDNTFATGVTTVASNTATYTPTQSLTQSTYYRRQAHDGTCNTSFTSSTNTWSVTVTPLPVITTQPSPLTLCEGESGNFNVVTSETSPGYQWQYSFSSTGPWTNTNAVTGSSGHTTNQLTLTNVPLSYSNFYVSCVVTSNGCSIRSDAVLLTVNPLPAAPSGIAVSSATTCSGTSVTLSVINPGAGFTTDWFSGSCNGIAAGTGNSITASPTLTTTYYAITRNTVTGCVSATCASVTVTVITPVISTGTMPTICVNVEEAFIPYSIISGSPTNYSIDFDAAAEAAGFGDFINWSIDDPDELRIIIPNGGWGVLPGTYNGSLTVQVNSPFTCISQTLPVSVTITSSGSVNTDIIASANPICAGTLVTFTATAPGATTYRWSVNGNLVSGETSQTYTYTPANGDVVRGAAVIACYTFLSTLSSDIAMVVTPVPTAGISGTNSPICAGENAIFYLTGTSGATVTYSFDGGSTTSTTVLTGGTDTITKTGATSDQTLTLVSVANGVCSPVLSESSEVTVNPLPATGEIIPD